MKYGIVSGKIDNDFFAAGSTQLITNATFAQDTLYHIACTWNLAATSQQIYVDGLLDVESSTTGNDDPGDGLTLRFGSRTGTNNFVYGHMTHVCMYDWVLPAKLIWDLAVDPFAMLRRKKAAPTYFVPAAGADPVTVDNLFLNQAVQRAATI